MASPRSSFGAFSLAVFIIVQAGSALLPAQTDEARVPVVEEGRLRVATWNLLNLFDNHDHPIKPDEGTPPKSFAGLKRLARVIDELDADLLGVQEVENREVLLALNRHLERPYLHVELLEGNDFRGIDVGLLSRFPIERVSSHRLQALDGDHRFARDFPLYRVRLGKDRFVEVGVVHLKSKRGKKARSDAWRLAESQAIRRIVKRVRESEPSTPVVVMGDFNDARDAETLAPIMSTMRDATLSIPLEKRHTFTFRGRGEQIDFIMTTPDLPAISARIRPAADSPSDHRPVVVELKSGVKLSRPETPPGGPWKPPVPERVSARDLEALARLMLQEVELEGSVVAIHRGNSGRSASLNFHKEYRRAAVVYIPPEALAGLPDPDGLIGKTVRVSGPISTYRGAFQVVLRHPEQLEVVK